MASGKVRGIDAEDGFGGLQRTRAPASSRCYFESHQCCHSRRAGSRTGKLEADREQPAGEQCRSAQLLRSRAGEPRRADELAMSNVEPSICLRAGAHSRSDELATAGVEQWCSALCFGARLNDEQVSSRRRAAVLSFVVVVAAGLHMWKGFNVCALCCAHHCIASKS